MLLLTDDFYSCDEADPETVRAHTDPYEEVGTSGNTSMSAASSADVFPDPRARLAALSILRLAREIQSSRHELDVSDSILAHRWSAFYVPLMWAAAGDAPQHSVEQWRGRLLALPNWDFDLGGE